MREGAAEALDKARELCKEGKYRSADQLFRKNILPPGNIAGDYQQGGVFRWNSRGFPHLPPISVRWICGRARQPPAPNSARGN